MSESKNIENLFQDAFEGHLQSPSQKVWNEVDSKLRGARINAFVKNKFAHFTAKPSSYVWTKINAALWIPRFLKFNISQLNIYYIISIAGISIASIWGLSNYNQNNKIALPLVENRRDLSEIGKPNHSISDNTENNNTNNTINSIAVNSTNNKVDFTEETNLELEKNSDNKAQQNNQNTSPSQEHSEIASNTYATSTESEEQKNAIQIPFNNKPQTIEPKLENNNTENGLQTIINKWMPILSPKSFHLQYIPSPDTYIQISSNSEIKRDEIVPDTIGYDAFGEPIIIPDTYVSFEPYIGFSFSQPNFSSLNSENNLLALRYTGGTSQVWSQHYGLSINIISGNFSISSGLSYAVLNENLNIKTVTETVSESSYFDYFENQQTDYDTTLILDLDAWLQGDTIYYAHIDSTQIIVSDSAIMFTTDTTFSTISNQYNNTISYVEIPLVFGYSFGNKQINITPSAGLIAGFLSGATGGYINPTTGSYSEITLLKPYNKILLTLQTSIKLRYYITDNFGILAEPWYRYSLNNVFDKSTNIMKTDHRIGLNLGLSYRF